MLNHNALSHFPALLNHHKEKVKKVSFAIHHLNNIILIGRHFHLPFNEPSIYPHWKAVADNIFLLFLSLVCPIIAAVLLSPLVMVKKKLLVQLYIPKVRLACDITVLSKCAGSQIFLPPSVHYLLFTPHWSSLGAL